MTKRDFSFALDTPSAISLNRDECYIKGWFVPHNEKQCELWLIGEGVRLPAFAGLRRPDVARHHQNDPAFKNSGFLVRFRRPISEAPLTLIARTQDDEFVLAERITLPAYTEGEGVLFRTEPLAYRPLFSITLGIPEPHLYLVTRCLESIQQQEYPHWQLCVACESREPSATREYLERTAREDARLKLLEGGSGLTSDLFNRALGAAEGDFVLRMDYRDELDPYALAEMAASLNSTQNTDLLYANEEEIDFYGNPQGLFLKPDFDPEAFLSWNFIRNGAAVRRSVLLKAGGYGAGTGRADDWDVMLRVLEIAGSSRVRHVPKALYRHRKDEELLGPREDKHSSPRAIQDYFGRAGLGVEVEAGIFPGSFRLNRERATGRQVALLVRSEDGVFQHAALAANVNPRTTRIYELLGSGADLLRDSRLPAEVQIAGGPVRNLTEMPADVFIFINRPLDTVSHHFINELAAQAVRADCGLVTGIALDRNGRILHSGFVHGPENRLTDPFAGISFSQSELPRVLSVVRSVDQISDEFFAVKRSQLVALGGFGVVSSCGMPQLVNALAELAHSTNSRVLVTPYAIATFDVAGRACHANGEQAVAGENISDELEAAQAERKLAAARLREISSERDHLGRELEAAEEALRRIEASQCGELRQQVQELEAALEAERRITTGIQNSLSWKVTAPLRACMRLVRGK